MNLFFFLFGLFSAHIPQYGELPENCLKVPRPETQRLVLFAATAAPDHCFLAVSKLIFLQHFLFLLCAWQYTQHPLQKLVTTKICRLVARKQITFPGTQLHFYVFCKFFPVMYRTQIVPLPAADTKVLLFPAWLLLNFSNSSGVRKSYWPSHLWSTAAFSAF